MSVEINPMNFVNGRMSTNISPAGIPYRSCFNTDYFDPNSENFQIDNHLGGNDSLQSGKLIVTSQIGTLEIEFLLYTIFVLKLQIMYQVQTMIQT